MTVYEQLLKEDWVQYFEEDFNLGRVGYNGEGKIEEHCRLSKDILAIPTCMEKSPTQRKCNVYLTYFRVNLGFIHSVCHNCWKVVVKPKTVVDLFKLYDIQTEMQEPSKCQVELRNIVPDYYGGYWYTRSLDDGKIMYRKVREQVDKHLSQDTSVILKRACTEYEIDFGPSDKWQLLPNQKQWEDRFEREYTQDLKAPFKNPPSLIAHIKRKWLHFAANQKKPDMTYLELTGGKPLAKHVNYVTYHNEPLIKVVK